MVVVKCQVSILPLLSSGPDCSLARAALLQGDVWLPLSSSDCAIQHLARMCSDSPTCIFLPESPECP